MQYNAVRVVGALGSGAGEIPWGGSNPPNVRKAGGPRVSTYYNCSQCFILIGSFSTNFRIAEGVERNPRQLTQPLELPIRFACRVQILETLGPSDCPLQLFPVVLVLCSRIIFFSSCPCPLWCVRVRCASRESGPRPVSKCRDPRFLYVHVHVHDRRQGRTYIYRYISSDCRAGCDHGTILYVRAAKVLIGCSIS